METSRMEAFSDGVFAVAITLLALDLKPGAGSTLAGQLTSRSAVAHYAAYVVSFLVIGIIWVNHHSVFRQVAGVDRTLLFINLLLLLFVAAIPFPTALLAEHLTEGADSHAAAFAYSAVMFLMGVSFGVLWWWVVRGGRLLEQPLSRADERTALRRFTVGNLAYLTLMGLALVSAVATLIGHLLVAIYYVLDQVRQSPAPDG
jgi:TMEM175 potassium channel family protein